MQWTIGGMTRAIELEQIDGPRMKAQRWTLASPFRIGRAEGNDLELADPGISRRHASIELDDQDWVVRDCGTLIGIQVNELALRTSATAVLRDGDVLGIGAWRFRFNVLSVTPEIQREAREKSPISLIRSGGNLAEQRLELLLRYAGDIATAENESMLAEIMAEHALLGSGYPRATVLWCRGDQLIVSCQRPQVPASVLSVWEFDTSLVESARRGDIARIEGALSDGKSATRLGKNERRALCAPLMLDGHAQAFLYLDSDRPGARRHADAPTFCHAVARLAALALANLHRLESAREHAAFAADLERAREVQQRLLPPPEGRMAACDYAVHLHPGRVVAGDVADVFEIEGGRVVVVLGDVSGAGLGAGLVMASVQSFLRAAFARDVDPAQSVALLNRHLCQQSSGGRFVTLWLGVFESDGIHCRFVDAGHGHALRIRDGGVEMVPVEGAIPLGIDIGAKFSAEVLELARGEILLLYSDGIIEQRDAQGREFSSDGLKRASAQALSPREAVSLTWQALQTHTAGAAPDDDATLLAISGSG